MAVAVFACEVYQAMLKRAARLVPTGVSVCFLADRGKASTGLMRYLRDELHWHFRIRAECLRGKLPQQFLLVKSNSWDSSSVRIGWRQLNQYHLALGEVVLLQGVTLTKTHAIDGLHLALARDPLSRQLWMVVFDEPTTLQTFHEYGERFQIEEELLDEKSNGFQLERSVIRSAPALSRLCERDGGCHTPADDSRTASGRSRFSSLGRCSLAAR